MSSFGPVGLFIVTATFHAALAVVAFLRMKIRPVRDASGRMRFRPIEATKATPETVVLDPRSDPEEAEREKRASTATA